MIYYLWGSCWGKAAILHFGSGNCRALFSDRAGARGLRHSVHAFGRAIGPRAGQGRQPDAGDGAIAGQPRLAWLSDDDVVVAGGPAVFADYSPVHIPEEFRVVDQAHGLIGSQ